MKNSNLIFGLMAAFDKREFSISDLMHLLAPFEITETCLRTTLSRMSGKGVLKSRRKGKRSCYSFSEKGVAIRSNVALSFRSLDWSGWDKSWWGVCFSIPEIQKSERYKIRKKLLAYRFVPLYHGFWIRPFNEAEKMENRLETIFLNKHCRIIRFHYFDDLSNDEVSTLWKLDEINNSLKSGLTILKMKTDIIKTISPEKALIEKMVVGDEIVNILFKDPLLPEIFLPRDWKGEALRTAFFEWDKEVTEISRPYWERIFTHEKHERT